MSAHHILILAGPYADAIPATELRAYVPQRDLATDVGRDHNGRACVTFGCGAFSLSLRPTAADLRRLAHISTLLADELEIAPQRAASAAGDDADDGAQAAVSTSIPRPPPEPPEPHAATRALLERVEATLDA